MIKVIVKYVPLIKFIEKTGMSRIEWGKILWSKNYDMQTNSVKVLKIVDLENNNLEDYNI